MEMVTMTMAHLAVELSDTWDSSAKTTCPFGLLLGARHHCLCINLELLKVLFLCLTWWLTFRWIQMDL